MSIIKIREAQVAVLDAPFLEALVELVRNHLPEHYAAGGEAGAMELAREATVRAARHGITRCRDVGRYLAFMVGLGWDFDTDPRYPWTAAILGHPELSAEQKLAQLLAVVESS